MQRIAFALLVVLALVASAHAGLSSDALYRLQRPGQPQADAEWCPTCVSFMDQSINNLLNIIANGGVLGTCSSLCNLLPTQLEAVVCNLLCDYVGIEAFIKLVDMIDPDSIYICEELSVCPISTNASAAINTLAVRPTSAPQGTTFQIQVVVAVNSTIGTGELDVVVLPPDGFPISGGTLLVNVKPGVYGSAFSVQTQPSEQEPFSPGKYLVQAAVCEGSCGSSHPYTKTLAKATSSFIITN